jgi:hypothetical protein
MLSAASVTTALSSVVAKPTFVLAAHQPSVGADSQPANTGPITPQQMQTAYGVNLIAFNGVAGTGAGQTIAIVDAYNDPDIITDTVTFNTRYDLQQFNVTGGPTLQVLGENGTASLPTQSDVDQWDIEESLDVQWVHSIAPLANVILYEANTSAFSDLVTAEASAAANPLVSVITNSWGSPEFSGENTFDSTFTTPAGHQGITFLASTGDSGSPSGYPAYSPDVVAVGGTSLQIASDGTWESETVWNDLAIDDGATAGGISQLESIPGYQRNIDGSNGASTTMRNNPDVAADADPQTGVLVYDSVEGGFLQIGGTSLASPLWAGMIGIADQGRVLAGGTTLNGATQTLPMLYGLPAADFHDVISGNNGTYPAGPGYDLVSGIGTPIANLLVPALAGYGPSAPIVAAPTTASLVEDSSLVFSTSNDNAINLSDPSATGTDSLSLSVSQGTLTLGSTVGVSITSGTNGSAAFTVSGTLGSLEAALNGLIYTPTIGYTGPDTLSITLTDPADTLSDSTTVAITVDKFAPPTFSGPQSASLNENGSLVLSTANGTALEVIDAAAGATGDDSATLSVTEGTLTLSSTANLTFTAGANGTSSFTISGTVASLDEALNGMTYLPNAGFAGSDVLSLSVTDPTDGLTAATSLNLTIIALAPAVTAPGSLAVSEDGSLTFSPQNSDAISLVDPNPGPDALTLSVSQGTLTLATTSGLTITGDGNGTQSFTATGSLSELTAALDGLTYAPTANFSGSDALSIVITNVGNGKTAVASVTLFVNPVPTVSGPTTATVTENTSLTFVAGFGNEITVTDTAAVGNSDSLTLSVSDGRLTLGGETGLTFTSGTNDSASFTINGTIGELNAALNGLNYQPNVGYTGSDTLALFLDDAVDNFTTSGSVLLSVNPVVPPVITAPATESLSENGSLTFSTTNGKSISVADNGAGINADTETLSVSSGTLTLATTNGLIFLAGSNGAASFTVKGTVSNFNAALNGLDYVPRTGYAGSDSLLISVADSTDSQSNSSSVALTVLALPPVITAPLTASLIEGGSLAFLPGNGNTISLSDATTGSDSLTLGVTHGTLTLATTSGLTFTTGANGTASFTVSGTVTNLNAALNGLVYQPTAAYTGSDTLGISVLDPGDNQTASARVSLTINTAPAPAITAPATGSVLENASLVFSSTNNTAIVVTDAAAGPTTDSLTLSVAHGTLTLAATNGLTFTAGANGTASFTVIGSVANLNAALVAVTYRPASGYVGSDSLHIAVSDSGDNESGSTIVALTVVGSIAPSITAPTGAVVSENGAIAFSSATNNAIVVADSGSGSSSDSLILTATHGTVALATTTGLTITAGANGSASITVTGSVANLNAALNGLLYEPNTGYTGSDTLAISIKDSADSQSTSASVALSVNAGNAPSIKAPATVASKFAAVVFSGSQIAITDNNAGSNIEELSLRTSSGTLTLASTTGITFISGANGTALMLIEGTLTNLNAALNGLSLTLASKTGTVTLAYFDLGNKLSGTAVINVSQSGGVSTGPGPLALTSGTTNSLVSSTPPDAQTQDLGFAAAVEMLVG